MLGLLAVALLGADEPAKYVAVPIPAPGDICYVGRRDEEWNRRYPIYMLVSPSEAAWHRVYAARDAAARRRNRDDGDETSVMAGTRIRVESLPRGPDCEDFDPLAVVVLEGSEKGKKGWMPALFLIPTWPYDPSKEEPKKKVNPKPTIALVVPAVHDLAYLSPQLPPWDTQTLPAVEQTEQSYLLFIDAAALPDDERPARMRELIAQKRMVWVPAGCKVEVVALLKSPTRGKTPVVSLRVLSGPYKGLRAWTHLVYITKDKPKYVAECNVELTPRQKKEVRIELKRLKAHLDSLERRRERIQMSIEARRNAPDYQAVDTDAFGNIKSVYTRMPDGTTVFATDDGYVDVTRVFRRP
jgi:hypothetical protein